MRRQLLSEDAVGSREFEYFKYNQVVFDSKIFHKAYFDSIKVFVQKA